MDKLTQYIDPSQYRLWILLGAVGIAGGLIIASLGGLFLPKIFAGLGKLLWQTGAILVTGAVVVGCLTDERQSDWLRTIGIVCAAIMATVWF